MVDGTRSDIVFEHVNGTRVIIEVVVTHDLEEPTEKAYLEIGAKVVFVRISTFDELSQLASEITIGNRVPVQEMHVVDLATIETVGEVRSRDAFGFNDYSDICGQCQRAIAESQAKTEIRKRRTESRKRRVEKAFQRLGTTPKPFRTFDVVSPPGDLRVKPVPLFGDAKRIVNDFGRRLCNLGFEMTKPGLFRYRLKVASNKTLNLYADLRGGEFTPIWKSKRATVYCYPDQQELGNELYWYIIHHLHQKLEYQGIDVDRDLPCEYSAES